MTGVNQVNLKVLLGKFGEADIKHRLSFFTSPLNRDVEEFIKVKAIEFAKQGIAQTHLLYVSYKEEPILVGYYALATKVLTIKSTWNLPTSLRKRINKFASKSEDPHYSFISAPLIAQLSKNFTNGYDHLISGDILLQAACDTVRQTQLVLGGKVVYVECEDTPALVEFYERNGFHAFDRRPKEKADQELYKSSHLVQLLKYLG